jgi:hypothetical protein
MPTLHCPLNGQPLIHIGTNKGDPVFWCERTDTAYTVKPHEMTGVIIGINPKCPERRNAWVSQSSISEQSRASCEERSNPSSSQSPPNTADMSSTKCGA